ncbi:hypothetical protein PABG_11896 [Paracoccidioides brasiliensis Pb03]|nr:hypothetical protein PABG_11896 [Paracoccidioides brasiliensis Pb03]
MDVITDYADSWQSRQPESVVCRSKRGKLAEGRPKHSGSTRPMRTTTRKDDKICNYQRVHQAASFKEEEGIRISFPRRKTRTDSVKLIRNQGWWLPRKTRTDSVKLISNQGWWLYRRERRTHSSNRESKRKQDKRGGEEEERRRGEIETEAEAEAEAEVEASADMLKRVREELRGSSQDKGEPARIENQNTGYGAD